MAAQQQAWRKLEGEEIHIYIINANSIQCQPHSLICPSHRKHTSISLYVFRCLLIRNSIFLLECQIGDHLLLSQNKQLDPLEHIQEMNNDVDERKINYKLNC